MAQIRAKSLHPLAITGDKRSRMLPKVPTAKEAGVTGFAVALNDPGVKKRLEDLNLDPHPGTPEQAAA